MPVVGTIQGADVRIDRTLAGVVRAQRATLERSIALAVTAGGDVSLREAGCGPVAAGGSVQIQQGGCGPVAAAGDVTITDGGCGPVAAGGDVTLHGAFAPIVVSGGDVDVLEGGRIGLSVQAPAAVVAAASIAGLILGVVLGRRR